MTEALQGYAVGALAALAGLLAPAAWVLIPKLIEHFGGKELGKLLDLAYEKGDKDWDNLLTALLHKVDVEIPDGIKWDHPKVLSAARGSKKRAKVYAALLRTLDAKAKEKGRRPTV